MDTKNTNHFVFPNQGTHGGLKVLLVLLDAAWADCSCASAGGSGFAGTGAATDRSRARARSELVLKDILRRVKEMDGRLERIEFALLRRPRGGHRKRSDDSWRSSRQGLIGYRAGDRAIKMAQVERLGSQLSFIVGSCSAAVIPPPQ